MRQFPSPTGVNYYELKLKTATFTIFSFRPQQGLTIMNYKAELEELHKEKGFRPQQGLTIMNRKKEDYYD